MQRMMTALFSHGNGYVMSETDKKGVSPVAASWKRVTRPVLDRFPVSVTGSFITLTHTPDPDKEHS